MRQLTAQTLGPLPRPYCARYQLRPPPPPSPPAVPASASRLASRQHNSCQPPPGHYERCQGHYESSQGHYERSQGRVCRLAQREGRRATATRLEVGANLFPLGDGVVAVLPHRNRRSCQRAEPAPAPSPSMGHTIVRAYLLRCDRQVAGGRFRSRTRRPSRAEGARKGCWADVTKAAREAASSHHRSTRRRSAVRRSAERGEGALL